MARIYATLENSKGKTVSISDNETITATVYDRNLKAYSVTIEFCDNDGNELPESEKTKGVIVSTREYRNQTDKKRKAQRN